MIQFYFECVKMMVNQVLKVKCYLNRINQEMNSSERLRRDGDLYFNCGNSEFIANNECQAKIDAHFEASCIVKASSDLLLYLIAVFVAGLLIAALIFWARKRCKLRNKKRKPENRTLIVSDMKSGKDDSRQFSDKTNFPGTKIPTYI